MIVNKGIARMITNHATGEVGTTTVDIVEKTEGGYTEVLGRINYDLTLDGMVLTSDYHDTFDVHCGKTVTEVLLWYGLVSDYTWIEPMAQVS